MIADTQKIIDVIKTTLSELVLPEMKAASWEAGNIRSCLVLLTYLEDALKTGAESTAMINQTIIDFLDNLIEDMPSAIEENARQRLTTSLEEARSANAKTLDEIISVNNNLKSLLSDVVALSQQSKPRNREMVTRLHECLRTISKEDMKIAQRAGELPPF